MLVRFIITTILLFSTLIHFGTTKTNSSFSPLISEPDSTVYQVDTDQSLVKWFIDIHNGIVLLKKGYLIINDDQIIQGEVNICMDSIINKDIDYELMRLTLQNTIRSDVFFDTENFPCSTFTIDHVSQKDNSEYIITGDLMVIGISKCLSFNANIVFEDDKLIAISDTIFIDRTDWGINSMSKTDAKSDKSFIVPDEFRIVVTLYATKISE